VSQPPILYSFRRCPYAMRARMALWISAQTCDLREVKLANKPPELIAASAKATVPVLQLDDGKIIDESLAIMRWTLGQSDPEGWLGGDNQALITQNDGSFKHHLDRYKYPSRYEEDTIDHRAAGLEFLQELDAILANQPQLSGSHRGLADIALFPFIRQFANTDRSWFDALDLPHLQSWLEEHLASQLFQKVMKKYHPWTSGDEQILFNAPVS
jgi:glutathione S-transferase